MSIETAYIKLPLNLDFNMLCDQIRLITNQADFVIYKIT